MIKKVGGVLAALFLFVSGTLLLVGYVKRAEQRAVSDEALVEVLLVDAAVATGDDPRGALRTAAVPARLVTGDTVTAQESIDGLVANTDLVAGEQLLRSRLDTPEAVVVSLAGTQVDVPEGFAAVTIPVSADRAFGGRLVPGTRVAVVGSFSLEIESEEDTQEVEATNVLVHKALVVGVQADEPANPETAVAPGVTLQSPSGGFLVTLAAPIYDVERIVFAAEWGSVWLAQQGDDASEESRIQTAATIFDQIEGDVSVSGAPTVQPFATEEAGERP